MIYLDCAPMRHKFVGLHSYCHNLASALIQNGVCQETEGNFGLYIPKEYFGAYGQDCNYMKRRSTHRHFFFTKEKYIWHSSYQLSKFIPFNSRLIMTVHDLNFLHEDLDKKTFNKYSNRLQANLDRAERVYAISEFTKKEIQEFYDYDKPIDVIYNGCTEFAGKPCPPQVIPQVPFLFSVATVLPKKNFHVLPCLLEGNDLHLYLAGKTSSYVDVIVQEAKKWGVSDRVHFLGPISEAEKHWYLQNCTAFVFPSLAEGFGLPVIEAMQYGVPVFLSDHTSLPEIGGNAAFYFNHEFDRRSMQKEFEFGMSAYNNTPNAKDAIIANAKRFSWDEAAKKYIDVYKQLLQE